MSKTRDYLGRRRAELKERELDLHDRIAETALGKKLAATQGELAEIAAMLEVAHVDSEDAAAVGDNFATRAAAMNPTDKAA